MDTTPIPVEALLAHREWVRSVARAVVRDPNTADDVEQDAWFEALNAPPRHASSLRGWFGAVVRNRARRTARTDRRRDARETAVARSEATQSAADLVEIADTHRRVVQAVVELAEPYRRTILLRYFEGLAVEDVAARTGVPIDTARSRISRGLAKLRERLEREFGTEDRPWMAALAPLIGGHRESVAGAGVGAAAGGGAIMATKTAWALGAALAIVGIGAVVVTKWPASASEPAIVASLPAVAPVPAPPPAAARDDGAKGKAPAPPAPKARGDVPAEPKPAAPEQTAKEKLAATQISGTWQAVSVLDVFGDVSAKADVDFVIAAELLEKFGPNPEKSCPCTLSMDNTPGTTFVSMLAMLGGLKVVYEDTRVVVLPPDGKRDETRALVPIARSVADPKGAKSLTVKGVVVDEQGAPLAHAAVVAQAENGVRTPLAETGENGEFSAELTRPYPAVFANVPGHVPSLACEVTGKYGETVELRLPLEGIAAVIEGRVLDVDGRDVPGVAVSIWNREAAARQRSSAGLTPGVVDRHLPRFATITTDSEGRFRDDTVSPGRLEITVFVQGKLDQGKATVGVMGVVGSETVEAKPSETVHVDVHLAKAQTWRGTLRDAGGNPVAGARIEAPPIGSADTSNDGAFVVSGVRPGPVRVTIRMPDGRIVRRRANVAKGEDLVWDPVVGAAMNIAGHVLDADGAPVRCELNLVSSPPWLGPPLRPSISTKADGSFAFTGLEAGRFRVVATTPNSMPLVASAEIASSRDDVELRVAVRPRAHLRGRISGADEKPLAGARIVLESLETSQPVEVAAGADGTFNAGPLPPDKYRVSVRTEDLFLLVGVREVASEDIDLGTLTFPPTGRVRITWTPQGDAGTSDVHTTILRVAEDGSRTWGETFTTKGLPGAPSRRALTPGRYVVQVTGPAIQGTERITEVRANADADLDLTVRSATVRRLALRFPGVAPPAARIRVTDESGGFVHVAELEGGDVLVPLASGRFRVDVDESESKSRTATVEIPAENAPETFEVVLR